MKKLLFLLGGVVFLASCSEDALQDANEQNTDPESIKTTNSFNENEGGNNWGDTGISGVIFRGDDYYSPWDIWFRTHIYGDGTLQPNYIISNIFSGEKESTSSRYRIEVFSYVGLAYFDGLNDGTYTDLATTPTLQYNLASGNYPNLYANGNEVGNLVRTDVPFEVQPNESVRIEDQEKHLLMNVMNSQDRYPMYNPANQRFVFNGLTTQEEELLATYGKVFFYEVFVYDAATNATIAHEFMQLNPQGYPSGSLPASKKTKYWEPVNDLIGTQLTGNVPGGFGSVPLYHLNSEIKTGTAGTSWDPVRPVPRPQPDPRYSDSREVIFDFNKDMHSIPLLGTDKLVLDVLGSSKYGWLNSSVFLHIE